MIKYHKNHLIRHYEFMIVNQFKLYKRFYIRIKLLNNIFPYSTRYHSSFIFTCFFNIWSIWTHLFGNNSSSDFHLFIKLIISYIIFSYTIKKTLKIFLLIICFIHKINNIFVSNCFQSNFGFFI